MEKNKLKVCVLMMAITAQISFGSSYVEILKKRKREINCSVPGREVVLKNDQEIAEQNAQAVFRVPPYRHVQDFEIEGSLNKNYSIARDGVALAYFLSQRPEVAEHLVDGPNSLADNQDSKIAVVYKNDKVGHGVIAIDEIAENSFIIPYLGKLVLQTSQEVLDNEYAFNVFPINNGESFLVVDPKEVGNETRFMNHSYTPNARIVFARCGDKIQPWIQAINKISTGEDICWNYGSGYWKSKGVVPTPDKEIPIYQGDCLSLYAVKVDEPDFTHVIVANDALCAQLNLIHHEVLNVEGHELVMMVHYREGEFRSAALDINGNVVKDLSSKYGKKVFEAYKDRFMKLHEIYAEKWSNLVKSLKK